MKVWQPVLDDLGEISEVIIMPNLAVDSFSDGTPAMSGFIRLPDGDVYRAFWPVFTEWFGCDECGGPYQHSGNPPGCGE